MLQVAEKILPEKCRPQTLAYCPTMDLIAIATETENIHVFRLNGQRVFGTSFEKTGSKVERLKWKHNGQILAAVCSNGQVRLMNSFSGKIVHQFLAGSPDVPTTFLAWAPNLASWNPLADQQDTAGSRVALGDLFSTNAPVTTFLKTKADLPRDLALIDIETSLPKLSTLPPTGGDDDVFSTRTSIDSIFHPQSRSSQTDVIDVLLTASEQSTIHIRIFDRFEIGNVSIASSLPPKASTSKMISHASHPLLSTHFVVVQYQVQNKAVVDLVSLDLNFIPLTAPHYLPILATKATQLQNLLRYLLQIQTQLAHEVKVAFDLPSRYLGNINETLHEHAEGADFVTAAYHLVVTGECIPPLKEWLVDEVGERGSKRWEKAVADCLDMTRRAVHECLFPALERCQVVLSRLDGLSRFQKAARVLGLDHQTLSVVRDTLNCLNLLANDLLKDVGQEIREFAAFIKWLKLEVEVQGLEETSERAEELREASDTVEHRVVLDYISGPLTTTRVSDYIRIPPLTAAAEESAKAESASVDATEFYQNYKKTRKASNGRQALPKLDELLARMKEQCQVVFTQIAETLRKSVHHARVLSLPATCDPEAMDMRVVAVSESGVGPPDVFTVIIVGTDTSSPSAVFHISLDRRTSVSNVTRSSPQLPRQLPRQLHLGPDEEVVDVQFVDDDNFMVLARSVHAIKLYSHPTQIHAGGDWQLRHTFEVAPGRGEPLKLEINGRKGRRAACVMDQDGASYSILDIDHGSAEDGHEEDGVTQI